VALVTSGTATLETAIMEIPMVIVYRLSLLTSWIAKILVNVPHIGLVNLVAGKEVVPELVQKEVIPQNIANVIISILQDNQKRREMAEDLRRVKEKLGGPGASERTARIALDMLENQS
jgi:lipid-A-disaccharide synthase